MTRMTPRPLRKARPTTSGRTTPPRAAKGVVPAAAPKHVPVSQQLSEFAPASPWARLQPTLATFDLSHAPAREAFLARKDDVVVGKDGIEFDRVLWWSPHLRRHTTVPLASKAKRPTLRLLFDAAANSRGALEDVTLVVLDEQGGVRERIRCTPRHDAQHTSDRDAERAAQQRYEATLEQRRAARERQANVMLTGQGAGPVHDQLAAARKRQGRPGQRGARASTRAAENAARGKGRVDPAPRTRSQSPSPTSSRSGKPSARGRPSSKRADAPAPPMRGVSASTTPTLDVSRPDAAQQRWTAFSAFLGASTPRRGSKSG